MKKALIGYTGFVGGNLNEQLEFTHLYNSKNIAEISGQSFDIVYCAGVSAKKWLANKDPENDLKAIENLKDSLDAINTKKFVLISTVDVYPKPVNVDEDTHIDLKEVDPYGKHRLILEKFVKEKFDTTIIRLPGLFGNNLKKNVIYDFLNNNCLDMIHQDGVFQFYNLDYLSKDIDLALKNNISLINFATENVSVKDLVDLVFKNNFTNQIEKPAPFYDFRTKYGHLWNNNNYIYSRSQIIEDISKFVSKQKIKS
ncbi:MAG: NAD-dependent epimerase/dehydratase family protein [Cytophagaceae bacterium]